MAEIPKKIRKELDKLYEATDNVDYVVDYNDHVIEIHSKNNELVKRGIYEFMIGKFPEKEKHYKKYLKEEM